MPSNSILLQKQQLVADLAEQIKNSEAGVVVNYQGITVDVRILPSSADSTYPIWRQVRCRTFTLTHRSAVFGTAR